jgi:hypothetical protein
VGYYKAQLLGLALALVPQAEPVTAAHRHQPNGGLL